MGMGYRYGYGVGVTKNEKEAVRWYRAAAEQGDASGQWSLGLCYEYGTGVPKDEKEAVRLYRLAAEQNDYFAQERLGQAYAEGFGGLPKDKTQALKWLNLAVENGSTTAQDFIDNELDAYFADDTDISPAAVSDPEDTFVYVSPSCPDGFYMVVLERESNGVYLAATNKNELPVVQNLYVHNHDRQNAPKVSRTGSAARRIQTSDVTLLRHHPLYAVIRTSEQMEIGTVISSRKLSAGQVFAAELEDQVFTVEKKTQPKLVIKRSRRFMGSARNYIVSISRERFELPMGGEISVYLKPDSSYQLRIANASLLDKQVPLLKNGKWDMIDQEMPGMPYGCVCEMDLSRDTTRILQDGKQIHP